MAHLLPAPAVTGDSRRPASRLRTGLCTAAITAAVFTVVMIAPGPTRALELVGPVSTLFLGPLLVAASWWEGWPLRRLPRGWAGLLTTAALLVAAVVGLAAAQTLIGGFDPAGLFATTAAQQHGHLTAFPYVIPLGALVFVLTVQLTLVCGKWPFARLGGIAGGVAALLLAWTAATAVYFTVVNWDSVPAPTREALGLRNPGGPVDALELTSWIACVACWQVLLFVLLDGWPLTRIRSTTARLLTANVSVLLLGTLTFWFCRHLMGLSVPQTAAAGGIVVGAVFLLVLGLQGGPGHPLTPPAHRGVLLGAAAVLAAALYVGLLALARALGTWTDAPAELWIAVAGLNIIAPTLILHVHLWRRWPLPAPDHGAPPQR